MGADRGPRVSVTGVFHGAPWLETAQGEAGAKTKEAVREGRKAGALPNRIK